VPEVLPNGEPYDHRATGLVLFVSDQIGILEDLRGYAGIVLTEQEGGFVLYWHGAPPPQAKEVLVAATGLGFAGRLEPSAFTAKYLIRLARRVSFLKDPTMEPEWGFSAHPASDASGLVIGTARNSGLHDLPGWQVADLLGIPVPVTVEVVGSDGGTDHYLADE
jgi:hypothetical protein